MEVKRTVVLLSGGIDSSACAVAEAEAGRLIACVYVDYGQPSAEMERIASGRLSRSLSVPIRQARIRGLRLGDMAAGVGAHVVPGRNAVILAVAANLAFGWGADALVVGAVLDDATDYQDCRRSFLDQIEDALGMQVLSPWIDTEKRTVAQYLSQRLERKQTWSCYKAGPDPCGSCRGCVEAARAWPP